MIEVDIEILIFALRYAIGRRTSAPKMVSDNVMYAIENIPEYHIQKIIEEIEDTVDYGDQCDKDTWLNLRDFLRAELMKLQAV